ncbi:MAG: PKD domain-containing protein [FCB group bacterium]|jgi:PKD repeat protein|nr:PKD domain-containing protein [FCB group bacterium]
MLRSFALAVALVCSLAAEAAPKAVIEINPENWYVRKGAMGALKGLSLTRGYAPFPVFFEGWKSEPQGDATVYEWDFGDESKKAQGFCGAHVYEKPGKYTVTLKVTDGAGASATEKVEIEVLQPDGKTYYVDFEKGDDANDGQSPEKPWKNVGKALGGMCEATYGPGDRILLKRGQTFPLNAGRLKPGHGKYRFGYSFATYGEGERPIIKHTAGTEGPLLEFSAPEAAHIGFVDLVFDGTGSDGRRDTIFACRAGAANLLFLRCGFRGGHQHLGFNGPSEPEKKPLNGAFVIGCDGKDSRDISIYCKGKRLAIMDNTWEDSGDHIVYGSWFQGGIFSGNKFLRPSFGKTCVRISGGSLSFERPTQYVMVRDNVFEGWIDPNKGRNGTNGQRWNYTLCTVSPNRPGNELIQHIRWENNTVKGFETALQMGACEDLIVRNNTFEAQGGNAASPRFKFGSEYEETPIRGVRFVNNTVISDETRTGVKGTGSIFALMDYRGQGRHEGIVIKNNKIAFRNGVATVYWFQSKNPEKRAQAAISDNIYEGFNPAVDKVVKLSGDYQTAGHEITINELTP